MFIHYDIIPRLSRTNQSDKTTSFYKEMQSLPEKSQKTFLKCLDNAPVEISLTCGCCRIKKTFHSYGIGIKMFILILS